MPSYWLVYFNVDSVQDAFDKATQLGGRGIMPPQEMPGGMFAIVSDPQGATFGLLKADPRG